MQIVIDIPDRILYGIQNGITRNGSVASQIVLNAVKNGTVLPKGHGDLVDKSKICKAIPAEEDNCTGMGMTLEEMGAYNEGVDAMYSLVQRTPTIIEADKEVEE